MYPAAGAAAGASGPRFGGVGNRQIFDATRCPPPNPAIHLQACNSKSLFNSNLEPNSVLRRRNLPRECSLHCSNTLPSALTTEHKRALAPTRESEQAKTAPRAAATNRVDSHSTCRLLQQQRRPRLGLQLGVRLPLRKWMCGRNCCTRGARSLERCSRRMICCGWM